MKKTLLISSFCFLLVGGGLKPASAPVSAETPFVVAQRSQDSTQTTPIGQTQVQLLTPGAEPKQELRFKPTVNAKQTLKMTLNMDIASSISDKPIPKVKIPSTVMTMDVGVTQVDANGDIHAKLSYTDADVVADSTVPPEVVNRMRSVVKKVVGLNGSFIFDSRGKIKSGSFVVPEGLDPLTKQLFEQVSSSLNQLSSPVPAEAVGKGAKWRASTALNLGGINLTQSAIYELVNLQDNVATLNVSVEQQAASQELALPGLPPGITFTLKSLNSQGQGQMTMQLDEVMPSRFSMSMRSNNEMNVKEPSSGKETTLKTNISMQMGLESQSQK
jgi:hypothetical protein